MGEDEGAEQSEGMDGREGDDDVHNPVSAKTFVHSEVIKLCAGGEGDGGRKS